MGLVSWWAQLGSNQQPTLYESGALTFELWARCGIIIGRFRPSVNRIALKTPYQPCVKRERIGRDLHDGAIQRAYVASIRCAIFTTFSTVKPNFSAST